MPTGGDGTAYYGEATMTPAQKRKDTMLKKKYEKSDDMMKSFKDQYGEKEGEKIFYAKIRKDAMKEDITDEALTIQDWNVDDIKFTEIETVDIIKAKPLKENKLINFVKNIGKSDVNKEIKSLKDRVGPPPDSVKKEIDEYDPNDKSRGVKDKNKKKNNFPKVKIKSLTDFEKEAMKVRTEQKSNWRDELDEDWQKVNRKDKTDGMSKAAVKAYRSENPGSKLKTAVTKDPKKLKKGSKSAKRRLAFCRRMKGMKKKLTSAKTRRDPDSRINKALRRWNC